MEGLATFGDIWHGSLIFNLLAWKKKITVSEMGRIQKGKYHILSLIRRS